MSLAVRLLPGVFPPRVCAGRGGWWSGGMGGTVLRKRSPPVRGYGTVPVSPTASSGRSQPPWLPGAWSRPRWHQPGLLLPSLPLGLALGLCHQLPSLKVSLFFLPLRTAARFHTWRAAQPRHDTQQEPESVRCAKFINPVHSRSAPLSLRPFLEVLATKLYSDA